MRLSDTYNPLIKSTVKETLTETLRQAELQTMHWLTMRRLMCMDYYLNEVLIEDGGKDEYLKNFFGVLDPRTSTYQYKTGLVLEHVNLTEQLIDLKARNYLEQPARLVKNGEKSEVAAKYTELLELSGFFSTVKRIEQLTELLHDIAVGVFYDQTKKVFYYLILHEYLPIYDESDPLQISPAAIIYPTAKRQKDGSVIYAYYDKDVCLEVDNQGNTIIGSEMANIGTFNFFFPHRKKPLLSHFSTPRVNLVQANQAIDVAMTALNGMMRDSGFKQLYIIGEVGKSEDDTRDPNQPDDEVAFALGSRRALVLTPTGVGDAKAQVGVLDLQVNLQQQYETIKFKFESAGQGLNLQFNWKIEGGAQSGFSLQVQNVRDTEDRRGKIETLTEQIEIPAYAIHLAYSEKYSLGIEKGRLVTDFTEPESIRTLDDIIKSAEYRLKNDLTTKVKLLIEENPDLDEAAAEQQILDNMAMNKKLGGAPVEPIPSDNADNQTNKEGALS